MQHRHPRTLLRRGVVAAATVALTAMSLVGAASVAGAATDGPGQGVGTRQHPQLTDTQKQCLSDALSAAGITFPQKPADGRKPAEGTRPQLTQEQRDAMKAAADTCGLPARGPGGPGGVDGLGGNRPQLTDTQKQCLSDALSAAGITLPQKPADGRKPAEGTRPQLTQEQRDAMKAAADKCGLPARGPLGRQSGQNV